MVRDLGIIEPGTTLYLPFHTFDSNDPTASVTLTGLATTDIEIYKDGGTTQRASDAGYALLDTDGIDFDGITGIHGLSINLADNTTAGFYAAGSQYWVVISSVTVDAATVNFILATFRIGYQNAVLNTTIATLSSQTSFTLTAGPAEDDALNGREVVIHDVASAVQKGFAVILDYTGSTKTVTLVAGTTFTAAATDNISVLDRAPLQPTVTGRTLDVSSGGEAGIDWANVGTPGSTVSLSATTVATVTTTTTATNVTTVNGLAANVITAAAIANGAIDAATFAADVDAEILSYLVDDATRIDASALNTASGTTIPAINTKIGTPSDLGSGATVALNLSDVHNHTTDIVDAVTIFAGTADSGSTTTLVDSALTQADADYWVGNWVKFTSGTLIGQTRLITDFVPGTDTITFWPATTQAVSAHDYVIIPAAHVVLADVPHGGTNATITLDALSVNDATSLAGVTISSNLSVGGTTTLTGAVSATNASNDIRGINSLTSTALHQIFNHDASTNTTNSTLGAIVNDLENGGRTDLILDDILADTAVIGALGAGLTAIIGADGDTLKTLSDQIDGLSTSAAPQLLLNTTIATLATQTSFTLTAGSADNDAYNGGIIVVTDQSTATQKAVGTISDYVGSTKTITLSADPAIFTMAVGDTVDILAAIGSAPTVTQIRQEMDSNSTQLAAIVADTNELQADWANGGRLDLILDARASQTSVDTIDGIVDAILVDTAEIGAAGAGLTAADDAVIAAIAALNNLSAAAVTAAVWAADVNANDNTVGSFGDFFGQTYQAATVDTPNTLATLATQTSVNTIDDFLDTEVAAIKAKTDLIPAAPAAVGDIPTAIQNADALLNRSITNTQDTADVHSLTTVVLAMLESSMSGTTWTIRKTGGTTFTTKTITVDAGADPITGVT